MNKYKLKEAILPMLKDIADTQKPPTPSPLHFLGKPTFPLKLILHYWDGVRKCIKKVINKKKKLNSTIPPPRLGF